MAASDELKALLGKYADDLATAQEQEQLFALIIQSSDEDLQSFLTEMLAATQPHYNEQRRQRMLDALLHRINKDKATVIPMRRRWIKWVAAACIIVLLGIATYVILSTGGRPATVGHEGRLAHDVPAPTNTRAVITLADGSKVYLDSAGNGTIAQENNVNVVKNKEGEIVYNEVSKVSPVGGDLEGAYNTLYNPRGSKVISLTLSDGTKVWLNSESSLRYPASFASAAVREVEITGEAYFEVKHDEKQPFKVHLPNGGVIEDIGTAFNVNSYTDEAAIKTTLIEGSVKVSAPDSYRDPGLSSGVHPDEGRTVTLKPGEQAVLSTTSHSLLTTRPDLDEVMAWKNGLFQFNKAGIQTVMRQVSRWYDVEVSYPDGIPKDLYWGGIRRDLNLSSVFKVLEESGAHFKIEGRKVIVMK
jgi:ferric-dicitrate binding protein FerR (iron transport regulator)